MKKNRVRTKDDRLNKNSSTDRLKKDKIVYEMVFKRPSNILLNKFLLKKESNFSIIF